MAHTLSSVHYGRTTTGALPYPIRGPVSIPNRLLKNVASGLQPGARRIDRTNAQEPERTEVVHEGESENGVAAPRPLAAPGGSDRRAGPPKADEHRSDLKPAASPDQGRAVVFQQPASRQSGAA